MKSFCRFSVIFHLSATFSQLTSLIARETLRFWTVNFMQMALTVAPTSPPDLPLIIDNRAPASLMLWDFLHSLGALRCSSPFDIQMNAKTAAFLSSPLRLLKKIPAEPARPTR